MGFNHKHPIVLTTMYDKPVIDILSKEFKNNYAMSICTPSISSSYSVCIEYMRKWFKNKFQPGFFKSEVILGKNILKDFLSKDMINNIRRNKPALAIRARIDQSYNRDLTDQYLYGRNLLVNRTRYNDCFFINPVNKNMLSIMMKQMKVDFEFRVKVSSFNTATDLLEFMRMACRANATETRYASIDFQVPKAIMLAIARDSGFEIKNNNVVDNCKFLNFLNTYSHLPFVCKFRGTKGEFEYFLKLTDMYIHLRCGDIDVDDGEREGQTDNNFIVSTEIECLFPAPAYYSYYSKNKYDFGVVDNKLQCTIYNFFIGPVPFKDANGWNQYMTTDYLEDEDEFDKQKPATIHFEELIKSQSSISLHSAAEYTKSIAISPSRFMDIKLFNGLKERPIDIDWNTYTIRSLEPLPERISQLVFYVDLEFVNNYTINTTKAYSRREHDNKYFL